MEHGAGNGRGAMRGLTVVAVALLVIACAEPRPAADPGSTPISVGSSDSSAPSSTASSMASPTTVAGTTSNADASCSPPGGEPWQAGDSAQLAQIGSENGLDVYAAEYPLPGETEGLWSQWGQGVTLADGRHLAAVGDHLGPDGNSYFFVYDPSTRTVDRFIDVLSLVDHNPGAWGYGKVHAHMVEDDCGSVWAFTYWGTRRDIVYGDGYEGDLLLQIDPREQTVVNHGPVVGRAGVPSMASPDGTNLVAEVVDADSDTGVLMVFDMLAATMVGELDGPDPYGFRALGPRADGTVVYSTDEEGSLALLDPAGLESTESSEELPGNWLRAVTKPTVDGIVYGVTEDDTLFRMAPDGGIEELGSAEGYTASITVDDAGEKVYWMPGAHGSAWEEGSPILVLDTATGETSELISLNDLVGDELGLLAGGTYSITYHDGSLVVGVNASDEDDDSGFGTVVLVVIEGL